MRKFWEKTEKKEETIDWEDRQKKAEAAYYGHLCSLGYDMIWLKCFPLVGKIDYNGLPSEPGSVRCVMNQREMNWSGGATLFRRIADALDKANDAYFAREKDTDL